jgi:hypothetical protein
MGFSKTLSNVRDDILTDFTSKWTVTPISYDNNDHVITYNENWVRISVRMLNPSIAALGQDYFRNQGAIFIQIFCVSNSSSYERDILIDKAINDISQLNINGYITTRDAEINYNGVSQDTNGVYDQTNISVGFYYDTVRT